MREEWKKTTLGDTVLTQKGFAFKSSWYSDTGHPIVKVTDFSEDSIDVSSLALIPEETAQQHKRYALDSGDVIVQTVGSWPTNPASVVGKCVRVPLAASGTLLNQNAVKLAPINGLDRSFLFYLLRGDDFKGYIVGTAQGAASQAAITLDAIRAYTFRLPPLPLQQRIGSILSNYEELIQNNQRRIRILEEMARSLYREWFVHFRFPGHESSSHISSSLGSIPDGWPVRPLCEFVSTQYGYTESASKEVVGPKYLRGMDINKNSYIDWSQVPYCPIATEDVARYQLKTGDVLVIRMADPGKVGIVEEDVDAVFASYLIRVRPTSERITPHYLFYLMESSEYYSFITGASTGTTRKSASAGVIAEFQFAVPPATLVALFQQRVGSLRKLITNLLGQSNNLRQTRDLLLPRLLSGQIRLEAN